MPSDLKNATMRLNFLIATLTGSSIPIVGVIISLFSTIPRELVIFTKCSLRTSATCNSFEIKFPFS